MSDAVIRSCVEAYLHTQGVSSLEFVLPEKITVPHTVLYARTLLVALKRAEHHPYSRWLWFPTMKALNRTLTDLIGRETRARRRTGYVVVELPFHQVNSLIVECADRAGQRIFSDAQMVNEVARLVQEFTLASTKMDLRRLNKIYREERLRRRDRGESAPPKYTEWMVQQLLPHLADMHPNGAFTNL